MKGDSGRQYRIQAPIELSFPDLGWGHRVRTLGEGMQQWGGVGGGEGGAWRKPV